MALRKGVATGMAGMAVAYSVQQSKRADAWANNEYVLFVFLEFPKPNQQ